MRRSACLLVIVPLLLLTLATSPVVASTDTHTAYFGVAISGHAFAFYDDTSPPSEPCDSAVGTFNFIGKASVTEVTWDGWELYQVVPGTLKAYGSVTASWSQGGVNYAIHVRIYPLPNGGTGWLEPEQDVLIFGGMYPPMLGYKGVFKDDSKTTLIEGTCGFMVLALPTGAYLALFHLDMTHFNNMIVELFWSDKGYAGPFADRYLSIPAAVLFKHEVVVL